MTIFVFGPSCSGKSTLCHELNKRLGNGWTTIDRDDLIEQKICAEKDADLTIDQKIEKMKSKIIVDTQLPWRKKKSGEHFFLILPPLEVLLKRDAERTIVHKRSIEFAYHCKKYVQETHESLSKTSKEDFDDCFDSSKVSISEEIDKILASLKITPTCNVVAGAPEKNENPG